MDKKILEKIEKLEEIINKIIINMVTKNDLKSFATKNDLIALEKRFDSKFASKDDLKQFTTKDDLADMKNELLNRIDDVDNGLAILLQSTEEHKADRTDLYILKKRVDKIEQKVFTN
jgi:hypothetical protein